MFSLLVEIKIRSRGPPDLRAVAREWAMAHQLRNTVLGKSKIVLDEKKVVVGKVILKEHFKPNGRKLTRGFATIQNKTKHFVQFAKLQEKKKHKQRCYHITDNVAF